MNRPEFLPSPREIAERCESIRRQWSAAERRRRTVGYALHLQETVWMPPQIQTSTCLSSVRRSVLDYTS